MPRKFLGTEIRKWIEYLVAIVLGNVVYFLALTPHLSPALRHQARRIDLGMALDFVVCLCVLGLIRIGTSLYR